MNYWKILGITLTLLSGTLVNLYCIKQIKRRTEAIRQILLMLDYIEISIKYQNTDIKEIFKKMNMSNKFSYLVFIDNIIKLQGKTDYSNIQFNTQQMRNLFSLYSCELLSGFFSVLGKSDSEGQVSNCETYKEFFREELRRNEREEEKRIKTFSSIIFGITLLILIIII